MRRADAPPEARNADAGALTRKPQMVAQTVVHMHTKFARRVADPCDAVSGPKASTPGLVATKIKGALRTPAIPRLSLGFALGVSHRLSHAVHTLVSARSLCSGSRDTRGDVVHWRHVYRTRLLECLVLRSRSRPYWRQSVSTPLGRNGTTSFGDLGFCLRHDGMDADTGQCTLETMSPSLRRWPTT